MAQWLRFNHHGKAYFGQLNQSQIMVYGGNLFDHPQATGEVFNLAEVELDIPCLPTKMVALVDNFYALVEKLAHAVPAEPLYFLKGNNSFLAS